MKSLIIIGLLAISQASFAKTASCYSIEELVGGPMLTIEIADKTTNVDVPYFDVTAVKNPEGTKTSYSGTGRISEDRIYIRVFAHAFKPNHPVPSGLIEAKSLINNAGEKVFSGSANLGKGLAAVQVGISCSVKD